MKFFLRILSFVYIPFVVLSCLCQFGGLFELRKNSFVLLRDIVFLPFLLGHYFALAFFRFFACLMRRRIFHNHIFLSYDWVCNCSGGLAALFRLLLALWRSSLGGKLGVSFHRRRGR